MKIKVPARKKMNLVTRILEDPGLVTAVQQLEPRAICRVIEGIGLEDAGEIVALATTEQLVEVFDEDLWSVDTPGRAEAFDDVRFMLWLEILHESGARFAAEKLAQMDEDFAIFALSRQILVIDLDWLALQLSGRPQGGVSLTDEDLVEKALESTLSQEFDELLVISRHHDGWDTVLDLLLELDSMDHDLLRRILERCCHLSTEYIEDNGGLYDVLSAEEMLEDDVAAQRETRRARSGFISPEDARSFLQLARVSDLQQLMRSTGEDPVTRAYFRDFDPVPARGPASAPVGSSAVADDMAAPTRRLVSLLQAEGLVPEAAPLLPSGSDGPGDDRALGLRAGLDHLARSEPSIHSRRMIELSYLANVLIAGCPYRDRRFRPVEAAAVALATANLGAAHLLDPRPGADAPSPDRLSLLLRSRGCTQLLSVGWKLLYSELSMYAARLLLGEVGRILLPEDQAATTRELRGLLGALRGDLDAGTPWRSRDQLASLRSLFAPEDITVIGGLMAEYPTLPETTRLDPPCADTPALIATAAHLQQARRIARQACRRASTPSPA